MLTSRPTPIQSRLQALRKFAVRLGVIAKGNIAAVFALALALGLALLRSRGLAVLTLALTLGLMIAKAQAGINDPPEDYVAPTMSFYSLFDWPTLTLGLVSLGAAGLAVAFGVGGSVKISKRVFGWILAFFR